MPVNTHHPQYGVAALRWVKCRDAVGGEEKVHLAGEAYLPRLTEQDDAQYLSYRTRALYYNATGRTLQALRGMVFRRAPAVDVPDSADYLKRDADGAGTPLPGFAEDVVEELLTAGRVGVLIDYPRTELVATAAEEQALGARPFLTMYRAEDIINWRFEAHGNRRALSLVVLRERIAVEEADGFGVREVEQWRVLRLVDGVYRVEVWRQTRPEREPRRRRPVARLNGEPAQTEGLTLIEAVEPTMRGARMTFIPFLLYGPRGPAEDPDNPPILDLVNVNLSHYRSTADYEHGLHYTGLPTAIVTGHDGRDQVFAIGSATAWVFPSPDVKAYYLEFSGKGLSHLREAIERKEAMMAALGARMLAPEKRAAEAADTVAMRHGGEHGALASVANAASGLMTQALSWCLQWAGVGEEASVQLNTDFMPAGLSAQQLTALVAAVQAGQMSPETLYFNLQRGDVAQPDVDFAEEQARIRAALPAPIAPEAPPEPAA